MQSEDDSVRKAANATFPTGRRGAVLLPIYIRVMANTSGFQRRI